MTDGADQPPPPSWLADALNPVGNLSALADVRHFARRTAEEFADRILATDSASDDEHERGRRPEPDLDTLMRRWRSDSARAADLGADLITGAAAMVSAIAARLGSDTSRDSHHIALGPVAPGATASTVFWVHNTSAIAVYDVRPHCTPLRSHLGEELGRDAVSFDPVALDPLPPRSSCGIEVRVAVPLTATPCTYVTVVLVSHVPDLSLPFTVAVASDPPAP